MGSISKTTLLCTALAASLFASNGFAQGSQSSEATSESVSASAMKGFELSLRRGQVVQLIAPEGREDGAAARQTYYEATLPLAQQYGFERHGQLNVRQKVIGDYDPGAFIFFSWPSQAAFDRFEATPEWPAIADTRPASWDELKIYSLPVQDDLNLTFSADKYYTVLVAWLNDETASDYTRYLDGIEPAVERAGGRFVYKMYSPRLEAHNSEKTAPGQITFVEWKTTDGFSQVQQSDEYAAHQRFFGSGVERFEFYWLQTRQ